MAELIEPKELEIGDKKFIISKFPALDGRKIISQWMVNAVPVVGKYEVNEEMVILMMNYVSVVTVNGPLRLSTRDLINNHTGTWDILAKLEMAMLEYNGSFFQDGRPSIFLQGIVQNIPKKAIKMLMVFSERLSQVVKRLSTN